MLNLVFDERLIFPPVTNPTRVLDCGYGAASWAIEMAENYPSCEVRLSHLCHEDDVDEVVGIWNRHFATHEARRHSREFLAAGESDHIDGFNGNTKLDPTIQRLQSKAVVNATIHSRSILPASLMKALKGLLFQSMVLSSQKHILYQFADAACSRFSRAGYMRNREFL